MNLIDCTLTICYAIIAVIFGLLAWLVCREKRKPVPKHKRPFYSRRWL
jgi:hypothetical protein